MKQIEQETVERMAAIMGEQSASAKALKEGLERQSRGQTVTFWRAEKSIVVQGKNAD
jgi:hypothetical protein